MSTSGELLFLICGFTAVIGAVLVVTLQNPLRSAMALLVHVLSLAGLYLTLHAELLAAIQVIVYAGAVVVLFVFVIMLMGPGAMERRIDTRGWVVKTVGAGLIMLVAGSIAFAVGKSDAPFAVLPEGFGTVDALAHAIYRESAVPFELVSVLLLVAIVAALSTAKGRSKEEKEETDPIAARKFAGRPFAGDAAAPLLNPARISTEGQGTPHESESAAPHGDDEPSAAE